MSTRLLPDPTVLDPFAPENLPHGVSLAEGFRFYLKKTQEISATRSPAVGKRLFQMYWDKIDQIVALLTAER